MCGAAKCMNVHPCPGCPGAGSASTEGEAGMRAWIESIMDRLEAARLLRDAVAKRGWAAHRARDGVHPTG